MAKAKTPTDEKFTNIDFNLFEALQALDRKDYGYYSRLTDEQRRKFNPYMLIKYLSSAQGSAGIQEFHILSTNEIANTLLYNEVVQQHPQLQWLMLCAAALGQGKQYHPWIPQIKENAGKLKERASLKDVKEYFSKVYPGTDDATVTEVSELFVQQQHKRFYLASRFPELKIDDINTLSEFVTEQEIEQYEREQGN